MTPRILMAALASLVALAASSRASAQDDGDERTIALTYHKLTGEAIDFRPAAERSEAYQRASGFDRPAVLRAEIARLEQALAAVQPGREFTMRVGDYVSEYDHDRGTFTIQLFRAGSYVPVDAFQQRYQLVFANASGVRNIAMPEVEARTFDGKLAAMGRSVVTEVHFRVTGQGDPAGGVTGARVVRAELTGVRLLDRNDNVVYTPALSAPVAVAASEAPAFEATRLDVAGLRVGGKAKALEATLGRLYGPVTRRERGKDWYAGYAGALVVNEMGCMSDFSGRRSVKPGAMCVTAFVDADDVVRGLRVERVFPWVESEAFRETLVRRYGAVAEARSGSSYALGWGPAVDPALVYDRSGPITALGAYYVTNDDMYTRGGNALPQIRVVLQLVDARWATARGR